MLDELMRRGLKKGIDFATQYPIRHSFILDFAFPDQKIAIECDGEAWHSNSEAKKRDGFKNLEDLKKYWIENIGEWKEDKRIYLYKFKRV